MHERSLMASLLRQAEEIAREHRSNRVVRLRVALGALSHLSHEHFREHFEEASRGTVAEGAEMEVCVLEDITDPRAQDIVLESADIEEP